MKINELKEKDLATLLNELFGLRGAKEIFAKHNIEMITRETELQGIEMFIKEIKELFNNSKTVKEYKQAVMFVDTQINTNKEMLKSADGFMKTMLEGMIKGFEVTKETAVSSQSEVLKEEIKPLLEHILNEDDKKSVVEFINKLTIDKLSVFVEDVKNTITNNIEQRYSEETKEETKELAAQEIKEEVKVEEKSKKESKKKVKEEAKSKDEENVTEIEKQLDDLGLFDDVPDPEETAKEEKAKPKKEVKQETKDDIENGDDFDDDFSDFDAEDNDLDFGDDPDFI